MTNNGQHRIPDVLLNQTVQHLLTLLEAYRPILPAGQAMEAVSDGYRIKIEQRVVIANSQLVVPQG